MPAIVCGHCDVRPLTLATHDRGRLVAERDKLSLYHAMIVAAALEAGCDMLLSEDMQDGFVVDGRLTVVNPCGGCGPADRAPARNVIRGPREGGNAEPAEEGETGAPAGGSRTGGSSHIM